MKDAHADTRTHTFISGFLRGPPFIFLTFTLLTSALPLKSNETFKQTYLPLLFILFLKCLKMFLSLAAQQSVFVLCGRAEVPEQMSLEEGQGGGTGRRGGGKENVCHQNVFL